MPNGCFVAGTKVVMADGSRKAIEWVRPGDRVLSKDEKSGKVEAKTAKSTSIRHIDQTLTLYVSGGKPGTVEKIETTSEHPFYVQGKGFVKASELGIGTSIVTRAGPTVQVLKAQWHKAKTSTGTLVYNFEVEGFHSYFVGRLGNGLWVHNNECDLAKRRPKLREGTQEEIKEEAPKTPDGDYIDPNTRETIPKEGPFDYGHKPNEEWRKTRDRAREEGWSREDVIEHENNPDIFQIEVPGPNRGHEFEAPD